jgi:hypothetical protein
MAKDAVVRVVAQTKEYDRKIDEAAKKLRDFGKNGMGSLSSLAGGWGKLAPAIGAAVSAHKLFDRAIQNSQALEERFAVMQNQTKTAIDNLFVAMMSGDWSAFNDGLASVIAKAGDAARAIDQLGNSVMSLNVANAKDSMELQQQMTILRGSKKGTEEYAAALEKAQAIVERMSRNTGVVQGDQWNAIRSQIASWTALRADDINFDWVLKAQTLDVDANRDAMKDKAAADAKAYQEEFGKLQREFFTTKAVGFGEGTSTVEVMREGKTVEDYNQKLKDLSATYGESIVINTLLQHKNDQTLEGLDQLTIGYYNSARAVEQYNSQLAQLGKGLDTVTQPKGGNSPAAPLSLDAIRAKMSEIATSGLEVSEEQLKDLLKDAQAAAAQAVGVSAQTEAQKIVDDLQEILSNRELSIKFKLESAEGSLTNSVSHAPTHEDTNSIHDITGLSTAAKNIDLSSFDEYSEKQKRANEILAEWKELMGNETQTAIGDLTSAMGTLGNAVGGASGAMMGLVASMIQQAAQSVVTISSLMAEEERHKANMRAAAGEAAAKAMAAHSGIPFVGIAMGVGMVSTLIATLSSLPKFAEGGVATRPTIGLFGEAGPEAIIPLDKLEQMIGTSERRNEEDWTGRVDFHIKDTELVGVLQKSAIRAARTAIR